MDWKIALSYVLIGATWGWNFGANDCGKVEAAILLALYIVGIILLP